MIEWLNNSSPHAPDSKQVVLTGVALMAVTESLVPRAAVIVLRRGPVQPWISPTDQRAAVRGVTISNRHTVAIHNIHLILRRQIPVGVSIGRQVFTVTGRVVGAAGI